jgi:cytochrome c553
VNYYFIEEVGSIAVSLVSSRSRERRCDKPQTPGMQPARLNRTNINGKSKTYSPPKHMKKILLCAVTLMIAGAVSSHAGDVKAIYDKDCAKCHGADGKGKTKMGEKLGVKDATDAKVQEEMKDAEMAKSIKEGIKEKGTDKTKMKAFAELSDDDIKGLVKYVRDFKK